MSIRGFGPAAGSAQAMTVEISAEEVLEKFARLPPGIANKYLRSSVRKTLKPALAELRRITPRGPTGNLKRAAHIKIEYQNGSLFARGILGYAAKRGGTDKQKGFHAYWSEYGTKARVPKRGQALKIPASNMTKYPYLAGAVTSIGGDEGPQIVLRSVRGVPKTGRFAQMLDTQAPKIRDTIAANLADGLEKAIAEEQRRNIRKIKA